MVATLKVISIILGYVALTAAEVAVGAQIVRLGSRDESKPHRLALWVHRVAGYTFIAAVVILFVGMLFRVTYSGNNWAPRVAWHVAAGLALFAVLYLKWMVVRPYRRLMSYATALGFTVYALVFVAVNLTATFGLLASVVPDRFEPALRAAAEKNEGLADIRFLTAEKCGKCHNLRRVFAVPRTIAEWTPIMTRMQEHSGGWIKDEDVRRIEIYLSTEYGPEPK